MCGPTVIPAQVIKVRKCGASRIDEEDIGRSAQHLLACFGTTSRLPSNLNVLLILEESNETFAQQAVLRNDEDFYENFEAPPSPKSTVSTARKGVNVVR